MHHPRMLVTLLCWSKDANTSPRSRPSGLSTLYARRIVNLSLSCDCTVKISSEYKSTASALSSCVGNGAFTRLCIHAGASALATLGHITSAQRKTPACLCQRFISVHRNRVAGLQDYLLFVACPNHLKETAQRQVIRFRHHH